MKIAYGDDVWNDGIKGMSDDQLLEAAGNVTQRRSDRNSGV